MSARIEIEEEDSPPVVESAGDSSWLIEKDVDGEETEAAVPYDWKVPLISLF